MLPSVASLHVYSASVERVRIIETTLFFSRMMGMNGGQDSEGRAKKGTWEHPCDSVSGRKMLYFQQVTIMGPNEKVCVTVTRLRAGSAVGPSSVCEQATRRVYRCHGGKEVAGPPSWGVRPTAGPVGPGSLL